MRGVNTACTQRVIVVHSHCILMKISFLPFALRSVAVAVIGASMTTSVMAQAPAPGAPAVPAAPGATPAAPAATPPPKPFSPTEKNFIKNAGKSLYYQIQIAGTAKTAFTDPKDPKVRVRESADKDLNKAWTALNKIAQARGETLTGELVGADKSTVEKLGKTKEDKFGKEWSEELAKEAKKLDKDFEAANRTLQDVELKTYVSNYTPIVHNVAITAEAAEKAEKTAKKK